MKRGGSAAKRKGAVRIVVAEDHVLLRELIIKFLSDSSPLIRIVAEVATMVAAAQACTEFQPDLLILPLALLGAAGGTAIARMRKDVPQLNVLVYVGPLAKEKDI